MAVDEFQLELQHIPCPMRLEGVEQGGARSPADEPLP